MNSTQSDFLNFSRWFAAFLVLAGHLRSLLYVDYVEVMNPNLLDQGFYFVTGFSHEAVLVFFAISGYLVGGKALLQISTGTFFARAYAIDRVSRLYAVYIAALLLTLFLDRFGAYCFGGEGLYDGSLKFEIATIASSYTDRAGFSVFFGNLLMLQTIVVPTFGSNAPLWSLSNEAVYYLIGPMVFAAVVGSCSVTSRLSLLTSSLLLLFILPHGYALGFIIWLLGAAFSRWVRLPASFVWVGLGLLVTVLVGARVMHLNHVPVYFVAVPASFLLILSGLSSFRLQLPGKRIHRYLADFSYSTYLVHFPIAIFLVSWLSYSTGFNVSSRLEPELLPYLLYIVFFLFILFLSWIVSRGTEIHTPSLRRAMFRVTGLESSNFKTK